MLRRLKRLAHTEWCALLTVTLLAAVLRLCCLDRFPPGLYRDEAYNGLDALSVLQGQYPIFFEANNGREPFFIYLIAISVSVLGRNPYAVRLVAALLGILTIPATYLMAKELWGQRVAMTTSFIAATTLWHINLSRIGFRAVSLPTMAALGLWLFMRGLRTDSKRDFAGAGFLLGLCMYTYLAARFLPLALVLLLPYWQHRHRHIPWRSLVILAATALVVMTPLLIYAVTHLGIILARTQQVSILNPSINQGNLSGTFLRQALQTLGMFNWRGDFIPRHNPPLRPVFDPIMGSFFLLGLAIALRHFWVHQSYALPVLYSGVMLLPVVLTDGAPHFLRAVGILPVVFILPAIGFEYTRQVLLRRTKTPLALAFLAALLTLSTSFTIRDYARHVQSEAAYFNFEAGAAEAATRINRFLASGWSQGNQSTVALPSEQQDRIVYLDPRLWENWVSLRFLLTEDDQLQLLDPAASALPTAREAQLVVWPYAEYSQWLHLLPRNTLIFASEGPLERGDLESSAKQICLTYEATPPRDIPGNLMVPFEQGIHLLGSILHQEANGLRVRLYWQATADIQAPYTVFVQWQRGTQVIAQSDSYPARRLYPTNWWRPGDIILDEHWLSADVSPSDSDSAIVGLYDLQTMTRLRVLNKAGEPIGDAVPLNLPSK